MSRCIAWSRDCTRAMSGQFFRPWPPTTWTIMATCLRTLRERIDEDASWRRLMPAFHIEGPCLSPEEGYRGAHDPRFIRPASREVLEPLLEAAGGPQRVAMVTLAPEVDHGLATNCHCSWCAIGFAGWASNDASLPLTARWPPMHPRILISIHALNWTDRLTPR